MTVRIVPRHAPNRTELYSGVVPPLTSDGESLHLPIRDGELWAGVRIKLVDIAEILLDHDPGDIF